MKKEIVSFISGIGEFIDAQISEFCSVPKSLDAFEASNWEDAIRGLIFSNCTLWRLEDEVRSLDASSDTIKDLKRSIDSFNQTRHNFTESFDQSLFLIFEQDHTKKSLPFNSETVGSIIDRLCVVCLKIYHMQEILNQKRFESKKHEIYMQNLSTLKLQRQALETSCAVVLNEIAQGKQRILLFKQLKMYNNPDLNTKLSQKV